MACFFGSDITHQFLKKYNLSMIIRSHQAKQDGYEYNHDKKVLTVFSASNYCGGSNWGAVVRWFVIKKNKIAFLLKKNLGIIMKKNHGLFHLKLKVLKWKN